MGANATVDDASQDKAQRGGKKEPINLGWLQLARLKAGEADAREILDEVLRALSSQEESSDEHVSGDAQFFRKQLEDARDILFPGGAGD